ncbi:7-keto-8-aminopelargonate synthetase-like enzyme [Actinoalloteichus sp. GBA129-24]|uniref:8-amino-7-oxononanoate synthase n=1 Tax=Actinoalloteichus fjordicus TaxID=1612552 RepID=A0AAC9L9N9_9PSEU|nr:7-keto-8-aminopelargonate synthetase-like enzyme [Actinoalloteichus fjordicus]APU19839.1 7-keto-8-aminopelargonate synthetase-like enzyme [Actinoalloteichus sp. GBA129-24]
MFDWLDVRAQARAKAGLRRRLVPRSADSDVRNLAGNDYLGLARDPRVVAAASAAARRWGAGSTGSRLVTGTLDAHAELERDLADFCGVESALVFSSGYLANLGALSALGGPGTLLVADEYDHASLIDGMRLSRSDHMRVPHRDVAAVAAALRDRSRKRALVVTDSVFSVDGDLAPLAALAAVCREHSAGLLIDDAHGLGVLGPGGRGAPAAAGIAGAPDVVVTATLSKSLGSQGGVVLGPARVIRHLVETARTFIFDTGLAPASVGAAAEALAVLRAEPELADRVRASARALAERLRAAGLDAAEPAGAVVSVRAPSAQQALDWAGRCAAAGVAVGCFRPPSVPDHVSRLRLTARSDLTEQDLDHVVDVLVATAPARADERLLAT